MNYKTLTNYMMLCDYLNLDTKKVHESDFYLLDMISSFEMFGITPSKEHEAAYNELLERAAA